MSNNLSVSYHNNMFLKQILSKVSSCSIFGSISNNIKSLSQNSKNCTDHSLFFCISGTKVDGTKYIDDAIKNGAVAVVLEKTRQIFFEKSNLFIKYITYIFVDDVRKVMAIMSANFYGNPQQKLKMIGITGTSGKTSTSYIIAQMLQSFNKKVGIIGTSGIFIGKRKYNAILTTPDSIELFKILADMVKSKVEYCVMEVSAHAIFFDKTFGINWVTQVLTNVKTDHLDFFKTKENYGSVKQKFFEKGNIFVVNGDDKIGKLIAKNYPQKAITYGFHKQNNIQISKAKYEFLGSKFDLIFDKKRYSFSTNLVGKFNCYNFACGVAVLQKLGFLIENIAKKQQNFNILGRFSAFKYKNNCNVIVDYAHTTDSLKNLLLTIKSISTNKNIIVFGCPGERESQKRFEMGKLAAKFCEYVIITTDNPASENPRRIGFEILCGAKTYDTKCKFIEDRKLAIKKAFQIAKENTNILIVGKGSEIYQIVGDRKKPYCDFDEIKKYL